ISRLCRARRIALVIAGDWRLAAALGAGLHLRRGRRIGARRRWKLLTSSAHGAVELRRARRAGAIAFLSPAFPTTSHPGAAALGAVRWNALARPGAAALGGIDGHSARRLRFSCAAGAIGALI
ncbi:MAG: thiamine phosphate synthase, partial [Rhodospirillales bacterium]|nr:thiamine phosphate synthase [Rhodospirillales bacterium]